MLPQPEPTGLLPPGIYSATLEEVETRFGTTTVRQGHCRLLRGVIEAALVYPTIKRVLLWGSFVMTMPEPNDLDYSLVVPIQHKRA